jgi:hypothetical protein
MRLAIARTGFHVLVGSMCMAGLAQPAAIASSMRFQTTGTIESIGVTGTPVIHFVGNDGSLTTGSGFDLGRFVVDPLPAGRRTTYNQTPFEVAFTPRSVDGVAIPGGPPVVLHGLITGTIVGGNSSNASFWIDRMTYPMEETPHFPSYVPPFRAGKFLDSIFDAPDASSWIKPSSMGGSTPLRAVIQSELSPEPVPEPSTIVLFAGLAAVAAFRRFRG